MCFRIRRDCVTVFVLVMQDLRPRLLRYKMLLGSLVVFGVGVVFLILGEVAETATWIPWSELGGTLVAVAVLSVWLDHFFRREQSAVEEERLRRILAEQAPHMRDAVISAFAAGSDDLARVATPALLDELVSNGLAMRLGDEEFAREIYRDLREQAIGPLERWHDASLSIDLSPIEPDRVGADGLPPGEYFDVVVRWEYTTVPAHPKRRFVCLSDRDEYAELTSERGATSGWFFKPESGIPANSRDAFELRRFSIDGGEQPIRRSERKNSQSYTVSIPEQVLQAEEPVVVSYTYRTITPQHFHLLFFDIEQPTRDLRVDFDYDGCAIQSVSTLDLVPSVRPTRIERTPQDLPGDVIRVDLDGWIFPRSGVAFVWTRDRERTASDPQPERPTSR